MTYKDVGTRIRDRRKELDMSADHLAERIGLTRSTVFRYENGDIRNIKLPVIDAMAQVLKVNPLWLIGKSEVKDGNTGYDVGNALDDLISDVMRHKDLIFHGKPVPPAVRDHLFKVLQMLKGFLED